LTGGELAFEAARLSDLEGLLTFVDARCAEGGVPEDAAFAIRLAVEEAFTNVVRHGYGKGPGPIRVRLEVDASSVSATLVDRAPPFDPANAPRPDLEGEIEDRAEGGLGWHLIRQMMDEVRYRPVPDGGNEVTMVKRYDSPEPDPQETK
jgi:serine/threonine-protein kinase RsbW